MVKIPKKLKIGGHTIRVDSDKELHGFNGKADMETNTIQICKKLPQSQKEATIIHEIFHFLNTTFDDSEHISHSLIDSLSEQLYQVLSDNKMLK